jgi:hypothetical protein
MAIDYVLTKTPSGNRYQLESSDLKNSIVKSLGVFSSGDSIQFNVSNGNNGVFGCSWILTSLDYFKELKAYERLVDVPIKDVENISARIYETLFTKYDTNNRFFVEPKFDVCDERYQQIFQELGVLRNTEKYFVDSGEIVFPKPVDLKCLLSFVE